MSRNKAKNRNIQQQSDRVHCYIAAWVRGDKKGFERRPDL